jgi:glutathione S-transferase
MSRTDGGPYELYYWPSIQGRGEFVRLALEDAGAEYVDVARLPETQGGGVKALKRLLGNEALDALPFAPPVLRSADLYVAQTPLILHYLGPRLALVPGDEPSRLYAHQLFLTLADFLVEIHDTHHPIGLSLYYEEQKPESLRRAASFLQDRLPKFLGYFESVVRKGSGHALAAGFSYVDLALFQLVSGLGYAFPNALSRLAGDHPRLMALKDEVARRPRMAAYLASERRIPFNQHGLFRHYPELDS